MLTSYFQILIFLNHIFSTMSDDNNNDNTNAVTVGSIAVASPRIAVASPHFRIATNGSVRIEILEIYLHNIPVYADNTDAVNNGLTEGRLYRTRNGVLMVVI